MTLMTGRLHLVCLRTPILMSRCCLLPLSDEILLTPQTSLQPRMISPAPLASLRPRTLESLPMVPYTLHFMLHPPSHSPLTGHMLVCDVDDDHQQTFPADIDTLGLHLPLDDAGPAYRDTSPTWNTPPWTYLLCLLCMMCTCIVYR